jgi:hypothetical protein
MTPIIWYVVISCVITGSMSLYSAYHVRNITYISGSYIILICAILSGLWDFAVAGIVYISASTGNLTLDISPVIVWLPVLYTFYRVANVWRDLFFAGQVNDLWIRGIFRKKGKKW